MSNENTQSNIGKESMYKAKICLPPIEDQVHIATFLDSQISEIDKVISSKQEQLSTLSDYKKSLIYEYVTGKKEVPVE